MGLGFVYLGITCHCYTISPAVFSGMESLAQAGREISDHVPDISIKWAKPHTIRVWIRGH